METRLTWFLGFAIAVCIVAASAWRHDNRPKKRGPMKSYQGSRGLD